MLVGIVVTASIFHLFMWILCLNGFQTALRRRPQGTGKLPAVSVIIAAKNEENNIGPLLGALRNQSYPNFEVLLADDESSDRTGEIVDSIARQDSRIRLIRVENSHGPPKKFALTTAIRAASNDVLAFTDADCRPAAGWLAAVAAHHGACDQSVLIGYGPFEPRSALLNRFIRYETLLTAFLTAAAVGLGHPYMAVGRNLSYRKSLFEAIGGYEHSKASLSGDDDLLIQDVVRRNAAGVAYMAEPASFVYSDAPATWRGWINQKLRHTSAGRFYSPRAKLFLGAFQATLLIAWVSPLILGWAGAGLLAGVLISRYLILSSANRLYQEKGVLNRFLLLDLLYLLYNVLLAPAGMVRKRQKW